MNIESHLVAKVFNLIRCPKTMGTSIEINNFDIQKR